MTGKLPLLHFLDVYKWALLWAMVILFATISSTGTLESIQLKSLFAFDKPIHATLFGIQALLIVKARKKNTTVSLRSVALSALIISASFGLLTEVMQGWLTSSRTFDYLDLTADIFGSALVCAWFSFFVND